MAKKFSFFGTLAIVLALGLILAGCDDGSDKGNTLVSLKITRDPTKTVYALGDTLDTAGMSVTATYTDGSSAEITDYTMQLGGMPIADGDWLMTETGEQNLTVHKGDISSSDRCRITVKLVLKESFTGTWRKVVTAEGSYVKAVISNVTDTGATLVYTEHFGNNLVSTTLTLTWGDSAEPFFFGGLIYGSFLITGTCSNATGNWADAYDGQAFFGENGTTFIGESGYAVEIGIQTNFQTAGEMTRTLAIKHNRGGLGSVLEIGKLQRD